MTGSWHGDSQHTCTSNFSEVVAADLELVGVFEQIALN